MRYFYDGPVMEFGKCIAQAWKGTTCAVSEKKARANLVYQVKKELGKLPGTKISLPGKITAAS